jgi:transcriptional regulator with XRE-family HTH domain
MNSFGVIIRKFREDKKLPLRTVAAYLDIDQAILSRIERGQRKANRVHVMKLAVLFETNPDELLKLWLADKVYEIVGEEENADDVLNIVAENIVEYKRIRNET